MNTSFLWECAPLHCGGTPSPYSALVSNVSSPSVSFLTTFKLIAASSRILTPLHVDCLGELELGQSPSESETPARHPAPVLAGWLTAWDWKLDPDTRGIFKVQHKREQSLGVMKAKFWPQLYQHLFG